jgi:ribosome-associated protein
MIEITPALQLDENELEFSYILASGPGGQNVNKVATAVQLRFPVRNSTSLPEPVKARLVEQLGRRLTRDGALVITARRFRSQERNREDAIERLVELVRRAAQPPRKRRKTRPSRAAKQRRLADKRKRGERKRERGRPLASD